jgi:hypothetical protein
MTYDHILPEYRAARKQTRQEARRYWLYVALACAGFLLWGTLSGCATKPPATSMEPAQPRFLTSHS